MSLEGVAQMEYASLSGKIHTLVIDKSLSISGAAADAKATGDAIVAVEKRLDKEIAEAFNSIGCISAEDIKNICC